MGYFIELHTQRDVALSRQALIARLKENKISEDPEDENNYLMKCGILMLHTDKLIELGNLASIHLSKEASINEWQMTIKQAENLGCRLYDPATRRFLTKNSFETSYEMQQKNKNIIPNEILEQKRKDSTIEFKSVASMYQKIIDEMDAKKKR